MVQNILENESKVSVKVYGCHLHVYIVPDYIIRELVMLFKDPTIEYRVALYTVITCSL